MLSKILGECRDGTLSGCRSSHLRRAGEPRIGCIDHCCGQRLCREMRVVDMLRKDVFVDQVHCSRLDCRCFQLVEQSKLSVTKLDLINMHL